MTPVGQLTSIGNGIGSSLAANQTSKTGEVPFSSFIQSMVNQSESLSRQAADAVTGVITGQGVEIHDALIATQKAGLAFDLALQIRNKAVAAYQQMMGMQF